MDLAVLLATFAVVLPVELPDKTFVASLVLATRFRPLPVWVGVSAAFAVQCIVAVTAGSLITLLPRTPLLLGTALLFAAGGLVLLRGAASADAREAQEEQEFAARVPPAARRRRAVLASFGVLFLAEWGDLSQLMTVGMVVRTQQPWAVLVGSWLALATVAAAAVLLGRALLRRVRLSVVQRIGGIVALALAALTVAEAAGLL